jgi:hypothetical protein
MRMWMQASLGGFESAGVGREEAAEKVRLAVTLADEARRQAWAELSHTQAGRQQGVHSSDILSIVYTPCIESSSADAATCA